MWSMFQHRGNHILKGATSKGKNMLPKGSIFFPLKVAPVRTEKTLNGVKLRNRQIKLLQYVIILKSSEFDAVNIK